MGKVDSIFLAVISWFNPIFERSGIDTMQLGLILRTKLLIDNRRPRGLVANKKADKPANTSTSVWTVIITMLMGALYGIVLFIFRSPLMGQAVYFTVFMAMMALTLITDFTNVLIDVRDQYIILPRPVNDRTVSMARILHITVYVMRLALLQGIPGMIMIGFIDGWIAVPLFLFQIVEATMFTIFMVNIIYMLLMRSVSPQRIKDIVSYFQIFFSIVIFAVFRLPRLFNLQALKGVVLTDHQWSYLVPPVWISALNEVLIHPQRATLVVIALALLGAIIPVISIFIVARILAPGFNRRLAIMASADGPAVAKTKVRKRSGIIDKLANWLAPEPIENAGFRITWKMAARTREFKMKVYPSFAYVPVYFVYMIFNLRSGDGYGYANLQNTRGYVFLLYMCSFILSFILQNISNTEKYKAAWVYYVLPIEQPGKILAGMYKAIITLYFLPYYLVLSIIAIAIWGPAIINDVLLAFFLDQVYGMVLALFLVKGLPFSRPVLTKGGAGRGFLSLFILIFAGLIAFGHFLIANYETIVWICVLLAAGSNWLMFKYYRKQTWENIEINEID